MFFRKTKFELSPRLRLGVGRGNFKNQTLKAIGVVCLLIAAGLTINAFSLMINKNKSASVEGEVLGTLDVTNSQIEFAEYKVQKGDTLFNLSQKYNINWVTLANLNNLKSPFTLKPGQTIKIPKQ